MCSVYMFRKFSPSVECSLYIYCNSSMNDNLYLFNFINRAINILGSSIIGCMSEYVRHYNTIKITD